VCLIQPTLHNEFPLSRRRSTDIADISQAK